MKDPNDELDEAIDRNLREAYRQVNFSQEWSARVLREVANESQEHRSIVTNVPTSRSHSTFSWPRLAALAAGLLLAIAWISWLASSPYRQVTEDSNESIVASSTGNATLQHSDIVQPESVLPPVDIASEEKNQRVADSVVGGEGYLAAKLSDDPKFEIYVVLPTKRALK